MIEGIVIVTGEVEILDGDDETAEVSSSTDEDTELIEGICNGVLATIDTSDV